MLISCDRSPDPDLEPDPDPDLDLDLEPDPDLSLLPLSAYPPLPPHPRFPIRFFVGAGARILFYPTLFYNVCRNKFEPDFRWWDQIEQHLILGAVPFPKDVFRLRELGVEAVVTLNESYETLVSPSLYESQMIKHLVIPTRDYLFAPSLQDIQRAVDFIHKNVEQRKTTYVHCKAGRGRSTTIVLCYLVKYRGMTPFNALNFVRSKRPRVLLADSQWKAVLKYSELLQFQSKAILASFASEHLPRKLNDGGGGRMATHCSDVVHNEEPTNCFDLVHDGESAVLVTLSDLDGYKEVEDDCHLQNDLSGNAGLAYKVGLMTAKSVIGVAKASVALARFSYIWLGYQTGNQIFHVSLSCNALCEPTGQPPAEHQPTISVPTCQEGLVEC